MKIGLIGLDKATIDDIKVIIKIGYPKACFYKSAARERAVIDILEKHPDVLMIKQETETNKLLNIIRRIRELTKAPVMIITDVTDDIFRRDSIVKLMNAGADTYISKPLHSLELIARLRKLLGKNE